jgi:hypothetical protein
MRQAELRIGREAARQMFPRIEAKLEKARKRALHRRARLGGRGRNRQAMKVLHRRPPERISLFGVRALSTLFRVGQLSHARHLW